MNDTDLINLRPADQFLELMVLTEEGASTVYLTVSEVRALRNRLDHWAERMTE